MTLLEHPPNAMSFLTLASPSAGFPAPYHPREFDRLASLVGLRLDEVEGDPLFDDIAGHARVLFGAEAGAVTLVREHGETFIGNAGMPHEDASREDSICAHTILSPEPLVVEDLRADARFAGMVHVVDDAGFRFYAGAPVFDRTGLPLGTVCVLGRRPRAASPGALADLRALASRASVLLETRRYVVELLGNNPHPVALHKALDRLGTVLDPLFTAPAPLLRAAA